MGILKRLLRRRMDDSTLPPGPAAPQKTGSDATPSELLNTLQSQRAAAEQTLLRRYRVCPRCESDYLRVGAWASQGRAGWTVTCVNCGLLLDKTIEIGPA